MGIFAFARPIVGQKTLTLGKEELGNTLSTQEMIIFAICKSTNNKFVYPKFLVIVYEVGILQNIYRKFLIKCLENIHISAKVKY